MSQRRLCSLPATSQVPLRNDAGGMRLSAILLTRSKWFNGKTLRYYFFNDPQKHGSYVDLKDGGQQWMSWLAASEAEKEVVRKAFQVWKDAGIGLEFKEVTGIDDAHIRIGFARDGRSWSWVGTENLDTSKAPKGSRTMNFGWTLLQEGHNGLDTAIHEIGHAIGFNHEHQNPFAGIEWNEEAVIEDMRGSPNHWEPKDTEWNILRKIPPDEVQGSRWDPNSIMHYPFKAGMINKPEQYSGGLNPAGGLSAYDKAWIKHFYPPMEDSLPTLQPLDSRKFTILPGQQVNLLIEPSTTGLYQIQTFGKTDVIMGLDELSDGVPHQIALDDDSGHDRNASLKKSLSQGKRYILRVRFCYSSSEGQVAVMISEAWS